MAKIISSEKNPFIEKNIEIFAQNKVGQFSKYLQKNPIFVTYYSINQQMSRSDTGTGSIKTQIGPNSPLRYNEIKLLPIYNLPELKPEIENEETGMDIHMELNGLLVLPNTVKPTPDDFFYLKFPGMKTGVLFRVTNFEFNTLQSNDFYSFDAELRATVHDGYEKNPTDTYTMLKKQVCEKYTCVFDNIGTQDRCLIRDSEALLANKILTFINELRDTYYDTYYKPDVGTFACNELRGENTGYLYDLYLIKFIKDSGIYLDETGMRTICVGYDDITPFNFDNVFRQTLWNAVLNRTTRFMKPCCYYKTGGVVKVTSPFRQLTDIDTQVTRLEMTNIPRSCKMSAAIGGLDREYFPIELTMGIIDKELRTYGYFDKIVFDYIHDIKEPIDIARLLDDNMEESIRNFFMMPLVIYILQQKYNEIFKSDSYQSFLI